jgi:DNA replicative helicase MCM subunit Mcm2 (Cdc46/Mcm family)
MIAPHLVGDEWNMIRKTALLSLASYGLQKSKKKRRLHTLLLGKPGTGKTELLLWWQDNLQGVMINSENTSKTGLVGDARGGEITPGLLCQYDGNFILLDELDKMSMTDQNGLLQAMEEGAYKIIKGKHRKKFQAEIRVIASANEVKKIQPPLIDRFDFIYECKTSTRDDRAKNVPRITQSFFGDDDEKLANILNGYMIWLGETTPSAFSDKKTIDIYIANYIKKVKEVDVVRASYRFLEMSIMRIAWAIAKLHKREVIIPKDVEDAIVFKHDTMRRVYGIQLKRDKP